jgi:hypothetical protein
VLRFRLGRLGAGLLLPDRWKEIRE